MENKLRLGKRTVLCACVSTKEKVSTEVPELEPGMRNGQQIHAGRWGKV